MASHLNGDNGGNKKAADENIIRMPTPEEREKAQRERDKMQKRLVATDSAPLLHIPPVTASLLALIIAVHVIITFALSSDQAFFIVSHFGFVPEKFSSGPFDPYMIISPITHILLHGGWMHLAMNSLMFLAFGSGIERWLGSRRMLVLFFASAMFGVITHYLLNTHSPYPMIGASGGLSGFFAAAIVMINRGQREVGGRMGILPFALLWIGLSIGLGMLGGPDGNMIAWAAHVGGFIGGFIIMRLMRA
jgi:membrane associated rhomboid family serine protease